MEKKNETFLKAEKKRNFLLREKRYSESHLKTENIIGDPFKKGQIGSKTTKPNIFAHLDIGMTIYLTIMHIRGQRGLNLQRYPGS